MRSTTSGGQVRLTFHDINLLDDLLVDKDELGWVEVLLGLLPSILLLLALLL